MKNLKQYFVILTSALMLASCSAAFPGMVTNNPVGTKVGVAKRKIWFGMTFGHTDLGIATAAKNGGITKVSTVDYKVEGGLFKKTLSTIVTGE